MASKGMVFSFLLLAGGTVVGTMAVRNGWLGSAAPAGAAGPGAAQSSTSRSTPSMPAAPDSGPAAPKAPAPLPEVFTRLTAAERAELKLAQQVKTLRAAIDLWKKRRNNRPPDFESSPMWQQFLVREGKNGPYFKSPPLNPSNNFFRVLTMKGPVKGGEDVRVSGIGWVYCARTGKLWGVHNGRVFEDAAVDVPMLESRLVFDLPPREQEARLLGTLYDVRAQLRRYYKEHRNRGPDFGSNPAFEQFLNVTSYDGLIVPFPPGPTVCGPYLSALPVNPLNGLYKVVPLPGEVRPGRHAPSGAGFVYSSSTTNIYAVDREGRILDDGRLARELAALGDEALDSMREQLALYRREHGERAPDLKRYTNWQQLTGTTRADGTPDPKGQFGPYLPRPPVNPRNGLSTAEAIAKGAKAPGYKPAKKVGWVYESGTGRIWLTDETGSVVGE